MALVKEGKGTKGSWNTHLVINIIQIMQKSSNPIDHKTVIAELAKTIVKELDPKAKI